MKLRKSDFTALCELPGAKLVSSFRYGTEIGDTHESFWEVPIEEEMLPMPGVNATPGGMPRPWEDVSLVRHIPSGKLYTWVGEEISPDLAAKALAGEIFPINWGRRPMTWVPAGFKWGGIPHYELFWELHPGETLTNV